MYLIAIKINRSASPRLLLIQLEVFGIDERGISKLIFLLQEHFDKSVILEGAYEDGLFGYAVACGDLDGDGFSGN